MKLRSILLSMLAVLAIGFTSLSLISCDDDDDDSGVPANSVVINGTAHKIGEAYYSANKFPNGVYNVALRLENGYDVFLTIDSRHDGETVDLSKKDSYQGEDVYKWVVAIQDNEYYNLFYGYGGDNEYFEPYLSGSKLYMKHLGDYKFEISFKLLYEDSYLGKQQTCEGKYSGQLSPETF